MNSLFNCDDIVLPMRSSCYIVITRIVGVFFLIRVDTTAVLGLAHRGFVSNTP